MPKGAFTLGVVATPFRGWKFFFIFWPQESIEKLILSKKCTLHFFRKTNTFRVIRYRKYQVFVEKIDVFNRFFANNSKSMLFIEKTIKSIIVAFKKTKKMICLWLLYNQYEPSYGLLMVSSCLSNAKFESLKVK